MEKKIKDAVNFLSKIFEGDYKSIAEIIVAEQESDIDTLIRFLDIAEKRVLMLKNRLKSIKEDKK